MAFFRLCAKIRRSRLWWIGIPVLGLYVVVVHWILGVELDYRSTIGPGLALYHGVGLVVHHGVVIGEHCTLRHTTTLGKKGADDGVPVLGNRVNVGPHVVVLGRIRIGDDAVIGAGSVVVRDVPARAVVAGNPARPLDGSHPTT